MMVLQAACLTEAPGVRHGFFGRQGGTSRGPWGTLNVGVRNGDDPEHVASNRARCAKVLDFDTQALVTARQVHGTTCVEIDENGQIDASEADGLVTRRPGILLGVVTADCAPVLLVDPRAGVIGACHAGWRGALDGIVEATVSAMERLGARPARIAACVGPCIAQASYEVGPEFQARFLSADPQSAPRFFADGLSGRPHFDLEGFVTARLEGCGIGAIEALGADTCANEERFFSHRRKVRRGEPAFGLQLSAIGLVGRRP